MFHNLFLENLVIYEIIRKHIVHPDRLQMAIWCMRIACCITKATDIHSEYSIFFAAQMVPRTLLSVTSKHIVLFLCKFCKPKIILSVWREGVKGKGKCLPQQAEVAQGLPGRLSSRIFLTFGTTRMVGC
jgi:hypothetical protein